MAYCIDPDDRSIEAAVRRIAVEQIDGALATLADGTRPLAGRVHEARKAVKKTRGLIRLVRPGFGRYRAENAALRDAGQTIRALRDAEVMLATFEAMATAADIAPDTRAILRAPFEARKAEAEAPEALQAAVAAFQAAMLDIRDRATDWPVRGKGFATPARGLDATLTAGRAAMKAAVADPAEDAVHAWRKRVKDHWYQTRLLRPLWPALLDARISAADTLGELLGDHNDLSVLLGHLPEDPSTDPLRIATSRRQDKLLARAAPLSRRLLAGPPDALAAECAALWKNWRNHTTARP